MSCPRKWLYAHDLARAPSEYPPPHSRFSRLHAALRVDFSITEPTADDPPPLSPKPPPGAPGLSKVTLVLTETADPPRAFTDGWPVGLDAGSGASAEPLSNGIIKADEVCYKSPDWKPHQIQLRCGLSCI